MTTTRPLTPLLQLAYAREHDQANAVWMTQPMGGGVVTTLTWREAFDETRRMAAHLRSLDLPPGSHIALLSKNSAWWILADLAIWLAGHVSIPIYPTLAASTVRQILEHSDAKLLFVGKLDDWDAMKDGVAAALPKIALPLAPNNDFPTWQDIVKGTPPLPGSTLRTDDEVATIVYTSGSTGMPKGVMMTFGAIGAAFDEVKQVVQPHERDRMLSYLPLAHVMERTFVECASLAFGFSLFFAESLETFVDDLRRARPTVFISVPRLWLKFQAGVFAKMPEEKLARLLKIPIVSGIVRRKVLKGLGLDHVRIAGTGSAATPPSVLAWYRGLGLELLEAYGMTENFCISHLTRPGRAKEGAIGEPYPGVQCRISDEGEVQVMSGAVMKGYYKDPELTRGAFTQDGFLKTGDRGAIDAEGRLSITGRVKELFKTSKGKYVAPLPIENLLLRNEYLEAGCVMGAGHPQPCAVVCVAEAYRPGLGDPALRAKIAESVGRTLAEVNRQVDPHEALSVVAVTAAAWTIQSGFLTPTMKIKRGVIEERYGPALPGWYASKQVVLWDDRGSVQ